MSHIVLTEEQARIVTQSAGPIEVRDREGKIVGCLPSAQEQAIIAEAKRRLASDQPRYPAHVVESRLRKLAEAVERDGLDEAGALALLERLRAEDRT
jgi:hypothetical protein